MANTEDEMDKPVTKRELHETLATWGGALEARFDAKLDRLDGRIERVEAELKTVKAELKTVITTVRAEIVEMGAELGRTLSAELGRTLSAELRQHSNRILEEARQNVGVVDDKYNDLPKRVESLEHDQRDLSGRVEALEAGPPAPKRQRRR